MSFGDNFLDEIIEINKQPRVDLDAAARGPV